MKEYPSLDEIMAEFLRSLEVIAPSGVLPADFDQKLAEAAQRAAAQGHLDPETGLTEAGWRHTIELLKASKK